MLNGFWLWANEFLDGSFEVPCCSCWGGCTAGAPHSFALSFHCRLAPAFAEGPNTCFVAHPQTESFGGLGFFHGGVFPWRADPKSYSQMVVLNQFADGCN